MGAEVHQEKQERGLRQQGLESLEEVSESCLMNAVTLLFLRERVYV